MELRQTAILIRKQGGTYSEIAQQVPVSKATLSLWLRDVPVPSSYFEKLAKLKAKARESGWEARRNERKKRTASIIREAISELDLLMNDPLWVAGLTLYWAEGSKEKPWGKGTLVTFTNMDPDTVVVFKSWCSQYLDAKPSDLDFSLYIHDSQEANTLKYMEWWATKLSIIPQDISVYYKHTKITHVRKNDNEQYRGVFRLQIKRSVDKNRKISGWILGLTESLKNKNLVK